MKRLLLILCAAFALAARSAAEGDPSKDEAAELVTQIEKGTPGAMAEAIKRLPSLNASDEGNTGNPQTRVFIAACGAASEAELESLRGILAGMIGKNPSANYALSSYALAYFRTLVTRAKREGTHLVLPPPKFEEPAEIAKGDPEMRRLWLAWSTARDAYNTLLETTQEANRAALTPSTEPVEETVRHVLAGPKPEFIPELVRHLQTAFSSNSRENIVFAANRALLLQTLPGKLTSETIGASFSWVQGRLSLDTSAKPETLRETVCDLLAVAGLDWEEVFAGAMVPTGRQINIVRRAPLIFDDMTSWQALAARGSPRGIRLGLSVIRKTKMDPTRSMEFIATALRTGEDSRVAVNARAPNLRPLPYRTEPLSPEVRDEVLAVLHESIAPERPAAELTLALRTFPRPLLPAMAEPLKKLLHHPSHPIAVQARGLLTIAKLVDENADITPPPPPLRIRVLADDQPLANATLQLSAQTTAWQRRTDAGGWLEVALDQELEPEKLRFIRIASIVREELSAGAEWPGPWLDIHLPLNGKPGQEYTATAETTSLEVDLDPTSEVQLTKPARIMLTREMDSPWRRMPKVTLSIQDSVTFQHLQRGTYYLEVISEGAARYQSKAIALGKNGSIRLVRLEPGRNVRVKFASPDTISHINRCRLLRNGELMTLQPNSDYTGWDGLPFGSYELRMDPWPQKGALRLLGIQNIPENGYEGFTHKFELNADSPPVVDLGTFNLQPAK